MVDSSWALLFVFITLSTEAIHATDRTYYDEDVQGNVPCGIYPYGCTSINNRTRARCLSVCKEHNDTVSPTLNDKNEPDNSHKIGDENKPDSSHKIGDNDTISSTLNDKNKPGNSVKIGGKQPIKVLDLPPRDKADKQDTKSSSGKNLGAIIGGTTGGAVALVLVAIVLVVKCKKRRGNVNHNLPITEATPFQPELNETPV